MATFSDLSSNTNMSFMVEDTSSTEYTQNLPLYRALDKGDWETAKNFLARNPGALTASLTADGDTALHVAVLAGNVDIVAELVNRLDAIELELKNRNQATALIYAATGGLIEIAEHIIRKNPTLITIPNQSNQIPVVVASVYGHKDMVRYLYAKTPKEELSPEKGDNGATLLTCCIVGQLFDVALDLIQHHRRLVLASDCDDDRVPEVLARMPSAFPSGSTLGYWQRWTYSLISIHSPPSLLNANGDFEKLHSHNGSTSWRNIITQGLHKLMEMFRKHLKNLFPAIKHIHDLKLTHAQAQELLCCICEEISTKNATELRETGVYKAVFNAVEHGIVEFIEEIIKHQPDIIWIDDEYGRGIFLYAAAQRQEKIFSLTYHMGAKQSSLATAWDKMCNNILHQVALLAPSSQLDRVSGPALQMQRELQWFKEVKRIVQPKYKEMFNNHLRTPRALFTLQHKELMKQGEEWMKKTAETSIVVAALIVTIMFAAVLTVPGGYDDVTGLPLYLNRNYFMVFIVSDAISLIASSTSLLMFLGILTSQYKEEDFHTSLPSKLLVGLSTLFLSIPTMMINFGITLVIMLRERVSWVSFPIILLGSLPVTIFALQQFPLILEILWSTYGPGIFDKPKKRWFFPRKLWKNNKFK